MASPEFDNVMQQIKDNPLPGDLPGLRAFLDQSAEMFPPSPEVRISAGTMGGVAGEHHRPKGAKDTATILYFHGGAYIAGSSASHRHLVAMLAQMAGMNAYLPDYRLAPENPFPAALDDAMAAYRGLLDQGSAPEKIALAGDSAGGGLVLATMLRLKQEGLPLPGAAACLSPWTDLAATGDSTVTNAEKDFLIMGGRPALQQFGMPYLGGADAKNPLASPLYGDPTGFPPLLIQVGEPEVLYDDSRRFADQARAAGVKVTFEPWPDMPHVWQTFAPILPEGKQALTHIADFFKKHL